MCVEECFISERNRWGSTAQLCIHLFDEAKKKSKQIPYQNFAVRSIQNMRMKKIIQNGVCLKIDLSNQITQTSSFDIINWTIRP